MRRKMPRIARLDQVRISREGEEAIIAFHDPTIATTHLRIGPQVQQMTDEEILLAFNQTIVAQMRNRDELGDYVAIEVPAGSPQVTYDPATGNKWSPRDGRVAMQHRRWRRRRRLAAGDPCRRSGIHVGGVWQDALRLRRLGNAYRLRP